MPTTPSDVSRYAKNLRQELEGAAIYIAMAESEKKPEVADLYRRLAAVETEHANFWREHLKAHDPSFQDPGIGWRTRVLLRVANVFGAASVLPVIAQGEVMNRDQYDGQKEAANSNMGKEERSHARLLSTLAAHAKGGWNGNRYAQLEGRHSYGGGNVLRAIVLGANDGLVSTFCLVMGVAGTDASPRALLASAVAGALAGACSMSMGEWVSVQSANELNEREIATEAEELATRPHEELEELALIYQAKGFSEQQAHSIARQVVENPETALDTLVKEELGINPDDLGGSPLAAASASFLVFLVGAVIPVLPLCALAAPMALPACFAASLSGLFLLGAAITIFTGKNAWMSGARQTAIGLLAAGVTFGIGHLFGLVVGG